MSLGNIFRNVTDSDIIYIITELADTYATINYVDNAVASLQFDYFLTDTASDIGSYYVIQDTDTGEAESSLTASGLTAGDDQLLFSYATASGYVLPEKITIGTYTGHFSFERSAGTRTVEIYWKLFKRAAGGAETELMQSELSGEITTKSPETIYARLSAEKTIAATDRLVLKVYANVGSDGTNVDVKIYQEGTINSAVTLRVTSDVVADLYLKKDGLSGGQIAYGGTDAGDDLQLYSTLNATKGTIQIGTNLAYFDEVNGRLGIGTNIPADKLHINVPVTNNSRIMFSEADINQFSIYYYGASAPNKLMIRQETGTPINMLTFDQANHIGVSGTDSPAAYLDFGINTGHLIRTATDGYIGIDSNNSFRHVSVGMLYNSSGNIYYNIDANNDQGNAKFEFAKDRAGITGGTVLMTLNESGNISLSGKLAISTATPTAYLDFGANTGHLIGMASGGYIGLDANNHMQHVAANGMLINSADNVYINIDSDSSTPAVAKFEIAKDRTGVSGGTELLQLFENGNTALFGKLAIGAGVTAYEFEVTGNSNMTGLLTQSNLIRRALSQSVNDDAEITIATATAGFGFVQAGDNEEYAQFAWKVDGTVTLIQNSTNVVNTDTDGNLCIYDAGTGIAIKNRLGATKTIRFEVNYS